MVEGSKFSQFHVYFGCGCIIIDRIFNYLSELRNTVLNTKSIGTLTSLVVLFLAARCRHSPACRFSVNAEFAWTFDPRPRQWPWTFSLRMNGASKLHRKEPVVWTIVSITQNKLIVRTDNELQAVKNHIGESNLTTNNLVIHWTESRLFWTCPIRNEENRMRSWQLKWIEDVVNKIDN